MDKERYNFQRVNEVAAIFSMTADGEILETYVTIRNKITKALQMVSSMDPNVEPWIYPLFILLGHKDSTVILCTSIEKDELHEENTRNIV